MTIRRLEARKQVRARSTRNPSPIGVADQKDGACTMCHRRSSRLQARSDLVDLTVALHAARRIPCHRKASRGAPIERPKAREERRFRRIRNPCPSEVAG
ncbi:hypothetical protein [Bradyrhizobium sp. CCGUVB14]|uniref:hypothetical protein n=1 Tax=Bradyrhizobium sp. CCGUVB14 TaxID=2949628 RepID=UPI0020B1F6BE|nr:hypothetical protein [Bradyrhizobium sp. CCGUVB14]MCP3440991.1 hypothetical protein [Bradyrhizobium sp. CCGUVB14]